MGRKSIDITTSFLCCVLSFGVSVSIAQEDTPKADYSLEIPPTIEELPPWYKVEVIVFEQNTETPTSSSTEVWPKNIALAYPPNIRSLKGIPEPLTLYEIDPTLEGETTDLNTNDTNLLLNTVHTDIQINPDPNDELDLENFDTSIGTDGIDLPQEEKSLEELLENLSFNVLPTDQRELNDYARVIDAKRANRILFHESWRQPMTSEESTPAIIVQGGEKFGENRELAGSIEISVRRYLHLKTNLWLTEFEANYGQEKSHWPPLPLPPHRITTSEEQTLSFTSLSLETNNERDYTLGTFSLSSQLTKDSNYFRGTADVNQSPYLTKNIVLLKQKRRMRSEELHYIDHPKIGLLIKLHPIDKDELTQLLYPISDEELILNSEVDSIETL